ncbi:MAG: hypothetical protein CMM84_06245 [Rhodothermaceae bacterium]|nr:hypothetical protein [Rhodothermaceae bacterium]
MRLALLSLVALATVALTACDSGDAIDPPTPADVAGVYAFEAFRFQPTSTALAGVSVLDTLVAAESFIELLDSGQATLRFRRVGGTTRFVAADFEVRRQQIRLTFQGGNEDTLGRLVLPNVLTFDRGDGGVLTLSESFTANLEAYDATRYGGFTAIPGTLTLRVRTSSASL